MDFLEELTTRAWRGVVLSASTLLTRLARFTSGQADVILANSLFTVRVFKTYFPSIKFSPVVVHPGINISAYEAGVDKKDPNVVVIHS